MGDLSFEYQDAVIAANYTENEKEATAIEVTYKVPQNTEIEDIEKALREVGIDGSTLHFDNNELTIIAFSQEEYKEIINKLKSTNYEYKEFNLQNSRYLDNESRRNTYRSWLNSEKRQQNRKLYNACSKALAICEATANIEESERLKVAQQVAKDWDAANLSKNKPVSQSPTVQQVQETSIEESTAQQQKEFRQQSVSTGTSNVKFYDGLIKPEKNTIFVFGPRPTSSKTRIKTLPLVRITC